MTRLGRLAKSFLMAAVMFVPSLGQAQVHGVDVQVNEGGTVPTSAQLETVLSNGDMVRDILGWQHVDTDCNLRNNPNGSITIPANMNMLYQTVQAAGGQNLVTLAFNNRRCGQKTPSGVYAFPDTDPLRQEFAAYAVAVVQQVPALGAVSIWNEMNGTYRGGYTTDSEKLTNYCLLTNLVISEIRKVNPTLPIIIGASVGSGIDDWFIQMFDTYGCLGKGDATIWLDVHPYLLGRRAGGQLDWRNWDQAIAAIRADGISNRLFATEWGGFAAYQWSIAHPTKNYVGYFQKQAAAQTPPWAGSTWFALKSSRHFPNAGLFDITGMNLTPLGQDYIAAFKH